MFESQGEGVLARETLLWLALGLVAHVVAARGLLHGWWKRTGPLGFAALYAILWALLLPLVPVGFTPFLYFQF